MNLYQASRILFARSARALYGSLCLSLVLLGATIWTLHPHDEQAETILVTAMAVIQVTQVWLKYRSLYWYSKGDEPRRMDQFRSGFGKSPSAEKCASIEQLTGPCLNPIDDTYWFSKKTTGARRMTEMILESSFSTRFYAGKCQQIFLGVGVAGSLLCVLALFVAFQLRGNVHASAFLAHVLVAVFVFFLTGDFWILGAQYRDLREAANEAHTQAFALLDKGCDISESDAMEIAMNYNTATAQSPPLIGLLYRWCQTKVDAAFLRHYNKLLGL